MRSLLSRLERLEQQHEEASQYPVVFVDWVRAEKGRPAGQTALLGANVGDTFIGIQPNEAEEDFQHRVSSIYGNRRSPVIAYLERAK